eukprot:COSAG06_NODE_766_length_12468_cov_14.138076_9_plen_110_part_00
METGACLRGQALCDTLLSHANLYAYRYEWPADQVAVCNIGELEMLTSSICAALQAQVHEQIFGPSRHYLIEHGDNSGVSDHVNNSMRAHSTGMRFLAERRALTAESRMH